MSITSRLARLEPFHVYKTTAIDYWLGWSTTKDFSKMIIDELLKCFKMQLTKIALAQYVMNELNEELRGGLSTDSEIYFSAAPFGDEDDEGPRGHLMYAVKCDNNGDVLQFSFPKT